jgi:hypothetical protein
MRGVFYFMGDTAVVDKALNVAEVVATAVRTSYSNSLIQPAIVDNTLQPCLGRSWPGKCCRQSYCELLPSLLHSFADERKKKHTCFHCASAYFSLHNRRIGYNNCGTDLDSRDT